MQTCRFGLPVLVLLALAAGAPDTFAKGGKDSDEPIVVGELGREIEAAVERAAPEFWGSVLVSRKGKIVFAKGYGMADYAERENTPRTLHEIASISKQVAATAILHLQQRRKLKLTDPLRTFFKGVPSDKADITVHQLLTHTSGISGNVGVPYSYRGSRRAYLKEILAKPLARDPGGAFEYSNVGYALLAAIVEEVTKKPFEEYVEKHLFKPAKMKDSGFVTDKDLAKTGRASGRKGAGRGQTAVDWHYGWGYRGMGGVVTTVLDLHRWDQALRGTKLLKAETKAALYTPHKNAYACGWKVNLTERGTRKAHHAGGVQGYGANAIRYLEDEIAIFALSNDGGGAFRVTGAIEKVLFAPTSIGVEIDIRPYGAGGRTVKLPSTLGIRVKRGKHIALEVGDKKHTAIGWKIPRGGYARMLVHELAQAIASHEEPEEDEAPAVEATLFLRGYGPSPQVKHAFGGLQVHAEDRGRDAAGKPTIDRRITLVMIDTRSGGRAGTVKLNRTAAEALHASLTKAAK